ncbi:AraC family transcriptional regulator [Paraliomyxa miuraensis]|uniref:AraC family transcriptional regulator n=1 Tax=Paraliomyxa miuraensis TaxID=376150 RepID=UPI002254E5DC|nr:AraC family transcriptional regulator [Paraliomyxa miuraensis]MCX4242432.1 AraC family transcriptional regulator [Paraliomyxa miuraensis]
MTGRASKDSRAEYAARVNRVIDHIERHLGEPLSLAALAEVAHLSRFHFHRIFGAVVGETLGAFVGRLRVERAAVMLVTNPRASITEIAIDCGFSSSATFARAFKDAFGMSATQWRASKGCLEDRKIRKALGNPRQAASISPCYLDPRTSTPTWRYEMNENGSTIEGKIEVAELPAHEVVYLRHVGPYGQVDVVPRLVEELRGWAVPRGLYTPDTRLLLVAHDSPTVTDEDKLRLSVCFTVPPGTAVAKGGDGEVGTMTIPGGKFAVGHFEIEPRRIAEAWNVVMGDWLLGSGFQPDDRLCYEEAKNDPRQHPEGKIVVDICVPVRPL